MNFRGAARLSIAAASAVLLVALLDPRLPIERPGARILDHSDHVPAAAATDSALSDLRRRFVGRNVYAFGGAAITCSPDWTHFYAASTPLRVRAIQREGGGPVWLAFGRYPFPDALGPGFQAAHPVRFVFAAPSAKPFGVNWRVDGPRGDCPAMLLADWQVDVTLTTRPPPASLPTTMQPMRVGLTRDEIIWTLGYPRESGDRQALRAKATWSYEDYSTVTFRNDRVVRFTGFEGHPRM